MLFVCQKNKLRKWCEAGSGSAIPDQLIHHMTLPSAPCCYCIWCMLLLLLAVSCSGCFSLLCTPTTSSASSGGLFQPNLLLCCEMNALLKRLFNPEFSDWIYEGDATVSCASASWDWLEGPWKLVFWLDPVCKCFVQASCVITSE